MQPTYKISNIKLRFAAEKFKFGCNDGSRGLRYSPVKYFIPLQYYKSRPGYIQWFSKGFKMMVAFPTKRPQKNIIIMQDLLFDFISKYISLTEDERKEIVSFDIFRSVKKGTILLKEGQKSDDSYFVLKGCIRTFYMISGEEKTTAFYTEMQAVTPPCVITKAVSAYYISSVEDTILTVTNPDLEAGGFKRFPKFETLCRVLAEELLASQQMSFDEFKTSPPEQRYLNLLQKRPDLIQRVPQHQLASYLGIKPQSLSRLRARILEKNKR